MLLVSNYLQRYSRIVWSERHRNDLAKCRNEVARPDEQAEGMAPGIRFDFGVWVQEHLFKPEMRDLIADAHAFQVSLELIVQISGRTWIPGCLVYFLEDRRRGCSLHGSPERAKAMSQEA